MAHEGTLGSAIQPDLIKQIKARGEIFAKNNKTNEDLLYCNANTPWICLRTGVTIEDKGDCRKNVLWGGLRDMENPVPQGISFSDRDTTKYVYNPSGRGVRPMPGITGLSVKVKDTYGCLMEADVKIKAWSLEDLNMLNDYYFKLGFSVLLEWGHTIFVDTSENQSRVRYMTGVDALVGDDWWQEGKQLQDIIDILAENRKKYCWNYEALTGVVVNFSYSFQKNGSYDCTVKLLSTGSTIFGNTLPGGGTSTSNDSEKSQKDPETNIDKGKLGKIFKDLSLATLYKEVDGKVELKQGYEKGKTINVGKKDGDPTERRAESVESCYFEGDDIKAAKHVAFDGLTALKLAKDDQIVQDLGESFKVARYVPNRKNIFNYIKFWDLLWMINKLGSKQESGGFDLQTPYRFVSFEGMLSLNPKIAIVPYTKPGNDAKDFIEEIEFVDEKLFTKTELGENEKDTWNAIGNIWLSVEYLRTVLEKLPKNVTVTDFISRILGDIKTVLGEASDFTFNRDSSEYVSIVDRNHVADPKTIKDSLSEKTDNIIPVAGLRSTLLSLDIHSDVSKDIANEFSIAAAAGKNSSSYKSTARLVYLEGKATDLHKVVQSEDEEEGPDKDSFKKNLKAVYQKISSTGFGVGEELDTNLHSAGKQFYNKALSAQFFSKDPGIGALQNGLIPVKVSFTMKGISGFLVGTCFKIDPGLLPADYDNWGYIITGVEHTVSNRGWETSVRTQYYPVIEKK